MDEKEKGMLLLCCNFRQREGPRPLTVAQFRKLGVQVRELGRHFSASSQELTPLQLMEIGYSEEESLRIYHLISREKELDQYLQQADRWNIVPMTRISADYPAVLHRKLKEYCPPALFLYGNRQLLKTTLISVVGAREITPDHRDFAEKVGKMAAKCGFTLVSGGAAGADTVAFQACLASGGNGICVVPDRLKDSVSRKLDMERVLFCSTDGFDIGFSAARAHARNRIIHCLGDRVFVVQTHWRKGGTWSGTIENLKHGWSKVFLYADGSPGDLELVQKGAIGLDGSFDSIEKAMKENF